MLQSIKTKDDVLTRADVRFSLETGTQSNFRGFRVKVLEDTEDVLEYKVFKFHKVSGVDSFDCNVTIKTKTFIMDKNDTKTLNKHIRKVFVVDDFATDDEVVVHEYYVLDVKVLMDNLDKFTEEYYELREFIELFNISDELLFDSLDLKVFRD